MLTPKKKLTRHRMKEDKLVTTYFKVNDYINQHSREITYAVIGVVAVLALAFFMIRDKREREQNASVELAKAKIEFARQAYPTAIDMLKKLIENYDDTKSAGLATIYLAQAYMKSQDYVNAQSAFETYLEDYGDDPLLAGAAAAGIAATFDERKEYAKAAELYEKAANDFSDLMYAPTWLMDAARCHANAGNKQSAKQMLQKLIAKYPKTVILDDAKSYLAELGA
jgi:TolA-binding protein